MDGVFREWSEFNVAVAGAGAALGGLLIVALSVNIRQIAESRGLAARAGASIATLILGVVLSCAALIPGQVSWGYGIQVLAGTAVCGLVAVRSAVAIRRDSAATGYGRSDAERIALFALPLVFDLAGGVLLVVGTTTAAVGLVLVAVATILAIVTTVLFSWVALVEVLR
ncbi:hypothetical protein [uncultured Leifsonia sp.]|uniref:hypothetical protein n=1 Tax=Leifsonia sp. TaxID=1870902 RepID=UPI0028D27B3C|nr:hypothetical protein [uncultured Leifsonia sp.]